MKRAFIYSIYIFTEFHLLFSYFRLKKTPGINNFPKEIKKKHYSL